MHRYIHEMALFSALLQLGHKDTSRTEMFCKKNLNFCAACSAFIPNDYVFRVGLSCSAFPAVTL